MTGQHFADRAIGATPGSAAQSTATGAGPDRRTWVIRAGWDAATIDWMFRFVLLYPDGEPNDPVVLVSPTSTFEIDEIITVGGEQRRVVAIEDEVSPELVAQGFGGVLVVEPV
jgi:hypothetical protein